MTTKKPQPSPQSVDSALTTIEAIGPTQINVLGPSASGASIVTVSYPAGRDTVLSVQPDGSLEVRPHGTAGPWERALLGPDRLTYENGGRFFILPYAPESPNP